MLLMLGFRAKFSLAGLSSCIMSHRTGRQGRGELSRRKLASPVRANAVLPFNLKIWS